VHDVRSRLAPPAALISFEHAVFLTAALTRGEQVRVGGCAGCGALMVTEPFALRAKLCHHSTGLADSRC
jgi:hypothetical protein